MIGEGEYGQVYGVKPTAVSPELGNMIKLGTTRYGKSSAELCQIVDWDGRGVIAPFPKMYDSKDPFPEF